MKPIDKDALLAELEKEIKRIYAGREYVGIPAYEENIVRGIQRAENIVNTLEVKEIDIENVAIKEWDDYMKKIDGEQDNAYMLIKRDDYIKLAKHFFKFAFKVKKVEYYD